MSARLRADEAYLVEQVQASLAPLEEIPGGLSLPAESVAALPQPLAVRAARILLGRMEGGNENCSAAHLEGLIALCRSGDPSAELNLPGGVTARRAYSRLILTRSAPPAAPENQVPLPLPGTAEWAGWTVHSTPELYRGQRQGPLQFWLDRDAVHALTLRGRRTGDRLKLPGRPTKTVKKWCVDQKIPAWLRRGFRCWTAAAVWPGWQAWDRTPLCSPRTERPRGASG
ncbi:MAG: tRNA lysidine(34) synthetase TilS [Lawsonibacter sp.]